MEPDWRDLACEAGRCQADRFLAVEEEMTKQIATLTARLQAAEAERDRLIGVLPIDPRHDDCVVLLRSGWEAFGEEFKRQRAERDALRQRCAAVEGERQRLREELIAWVDERIEAEVVNRPDENRYKRTLSETWAQVRRRLELIPDFARPATPTEGEGVLDDATRAKLNTAFDSLWPLPWSYDDERGQIICTAHSDEMPIICGPPPKSWREPWPHVAEAIIEVLSVARRLLARPATSTEAGEAKGD